MSKRPSDLSLARYRALAELRYQLRRFLAFSERAAREAGVEPQQHQLLLVLKALGPGDRRTVGTVAERLLIQHNSAVELVRRSVERGLVERRTGKADRREAELHLTREGERVLGGLAVAHREELRSAAPALAAALAGAVRAPRRSKS